MKIGQKRRDISVNRLYGQLHTWKHQLLNSNLDTESIDLCDSLLQQFSVLYSPVGQAFAWGQQESGHLSIK